MSALPPGTRLGRYEISSKLGSGGMGEVYLAHDTQLGRHVALKLLPLDESDDAHARKRLVREARAAATLDHPNICAVYEVGDASGQPFIAMQFVEGEPLDIRIKRGPLTLDDAIAIGAEVADALAHAHASGIIHRDIKPSNISITASGRAVVLDFGLAKRQDRAEVTSDAPTESLLSAPGTVMGTVPYMSPEQVRAEAVDGRSDIFSLGVLLYEMVAGRRPFGESSPAATASAILTRDPDPLGRFSADVPDELQRVVSKSLRKAAAERYQTAAEIAVDLRALRAERDFARRVERSGAASSPGAAAAPPRARRVGAVVAAVIVIAATAAAGGWMWRRAKVEEARALLPRIEALADAGRYVEAYPIAEQAERNLAGDPTISRLMTAVSMTISVATTPPGASVYLRPFAPAANGELPDRMRVGTTPLTDLRVARGEYVLAIERDGYAPVERTVSGAALRAINLVVMPPPIAIDLVMRPEAEVPARMTFVPGSEYRLVAWARPTDARVSLDDFFIDKYEVTNGEFKAFIDAGGYLQRDLWRHGFVDEGRTLPWAEAMRAFVDRSGLPGPRGWSGQNVPEGKADHPVTGVTWYEAAAYAAFRGKALPTVFQWEKAARDGATVPLVNYMPWGPFYPGETLDHHANFDSSGTLPVTSSVFGMSPFGAYNMAGNVTEWTRNETSLGFLATGGGWRERTYAFAQHAMLPGFYSSDTLGFRCAITAPGARGDQGAARIEVHEQIPVYTPSTRAAFDAVSAAYRYEPGDLDARVEESVDTPEWTRERISFTATDGGRATAFLYLPRHHPRPLSVVHFVPAGDVEQGLRSLSDSIESQLAPFIKSGRAVFGVVLRGYIGRLRPGGAARADPATAEHLDEMVDRITDLRLGLDYLATRSEIDSGRIAFYGPSSGGQVGLILAAIESRYRAVALLGAGLPAGIVNRLDAANPVLFAAHIAGPTVLIQGRYDEDTPLRTAAEPLFALLPEPKKLVVYEGGHVPALDYISRTLGAWLDETLGPVR